MIRRPPRSTLSSSSAASDVYKRQAYILPQVRSDPSCGSIFIILWQLQNARQLCEFALEQMEETMSWPSLSFGCVSQLADRVWDLLRQVKQEFVYPAKYMFPNSFQSNTVFGADFPTDVVVDLFLRHGQLVVMATGFLQARGSSSPSKASTQLVHKHTRVEVQEQLECVYAMEELEQAMLIIDSGFAICTHLRDQLAALRACT
eukprot:TRINITY_DN14379_c0_g1_i4.p1 TRINITY_DN14379_c0_g1~~TRINITY_DN14379_c0_g1_i4.p1  ORF type:complete len:203 (+),score=48.58 TRINITY_DN14379_c0_g1_i4:77-685(+)